MKRIFELYQDGVHKFDFVMDFGLDFCIVYKREKDSQTKQDVFVYRKTLP